MTDSTNPHQHPGHDDPSRAGAGEGPDAQPDGTVLDEDEQAPDPGPDGDGTDDDAKAVEDEAAKLGDFA